eukprot:157535_1
MDSLKKENISNTKVMLKSLIDEWLSMTTDTDSKENEDDEWIRGIIGMAGWSYDKHKVLMNLNDEFITKLIKNYQKVVKKTKRKKCRIPTLPTINNNDISKFNSQSVPNSNRYSPTQHRKLKQKKTISKTVD